MGNEFFHLPGLIVHDLDELSSSITAASSSTDIESFSLILALASKP